MPKQLSVIIPAFNEEHGIDTVLVELSRVLRNSDIKDYEIIVVDDGSEDGTSKAAERHEDVTVIRHKNNRGYGAALKSGIRHARSKLICITDADGTYPNDRIPELTKSMIANGNDMVVGSRTGRKVKIPLIRRPAKWMITKLAGMIAGESIPDINSGLRIFRRTVVLRFFNLLPDGFSFTTTITLGMITNGYLVDYIPINYEKRIGKSKIRPIRDTLNFVQLILRIALYFNPLKLFVPLSGLVLLIGIGWGVFTKFVLGKLADISTIVIVMASIQIAVIGLLAELIDRRLPNYHREEE